MKIAIVGLGIMGAAMAKRLLGANHQVVVYNRTREKAQATLELGAQWAGTPAEAASDAGIVITMVTDPKAVDDVTFGPTGILTALTDGGIHAEMSSIAPDASTKLANAYAEKARKFVQAPVFGSHNNIENTTLLIAAGGDAEAIETCRPVWDVFAKRVLTVDSPAQASALKLAVNMLMGQMILGLGQSLTLARKYDVPSSLFLDLIGDSALAAPQFKAKGALIAKDQFPASFTISNLLKDLALGADAGVIKGWTPPMNTLAREIFTQAVTAGLGNDDYSAVVKVLASQADVTLAD